MFLGGMWIGTYVEQFRSDENLIWVYKRGKDIQHLTFFLCPIAGIANGVWIVVRNQTKWKKNFVWILISLFPITYFVTMMVLALT